jgi:hypothetical protein
MNEQLTEALGREGDVCRGCRARLAPDQRYCLNCGRRRGDARVDFESELLGDGARPASATPAAPPGPAKASGAWTPLSIVGSVAALGVMLLLGVLIGRDNNNEPVQVAAAPAPVTQTASAGTNDTGAGSDTSTKAADKSGDTDKGGGGADKGGGGGEKDDFVPADQADGATEVSDDTLDALDNTSGDDYADQSKKLPDTIALPGEPPPTDNKEPGGGEGGAQVIK